MVGLKSGELPWSKVTRGGGETDGSRRQIRRGSKNSPPSRISVPGISWATALTLNWTPTHLLCFPRALSDPPKKGPIVVILRGGSPFGDKGDPKYGSLVMVKFR